nr:MAG TPA: hypothetical protein [Caudoviricetes sp.]
MLKCQYAKETSKLVSVLTDSNFKISHTTE